MTPNRKDAVHLFNGQTVVSREPGSNVISFGTGGIRPQKECPDLSLQKHGTDQASVIMTEETDSLGSNSAEKDLQSLVNSRSNLIQQGALTARKANSAWGCIDRRVGKGQTR